METNFRLFGYGAISGMCGLVISHPFDTIKTHIQTNKKVVYSIKNLYRGLLPPLLGVGIEKAVVFGSYHLAYKYTNSIFTSGCIAGLSASLIVAPYERCKILLQQSQNNNKFITFNNLNIKFLYKGLTATFTREVPGFGIYFSIFENIKNRIFSGSVNIIESFVLGGLAGATAWIFIYPQDMIKTRIQSCLTNNKNNNSSFIKTIKEIYKNGGYRQFYKGFNLALMRAIPLHAGTFCTMEFLKTNYLNTII